MSSADLDFLAEHRIPEVIEQLSAAILRDKPEDHVTYSKTWLTNLRTKMTQNSTTRAFGVNLSSIDGNAPMKKAVNFQHLSPGRKGQTVKDSLSTSASGSRWSHLASSVGGSKRAKSAKALKELVDQVELEDHPEAYKLLSDFIKKKKSKKSTLDTNEPNSFMKSISATNNQKTGKGMNKNVLATVGGAKEDGGNSGKDAFNESISKDKAHRRIAVSAAPIEFAKVSDFKPKVIEKSEEIEQSLRDVVASSTLYTSFDVDEREVVVKAMHCENFGSGQNILTQGEAGKDTFYLITKGTVEVIKDGKVIVALSEGQYFGELELMYNVPSCAATIRTVTQVETWALEKEMYQNIVLHNTLARRETFLAQINKVPFLTDISDYDKMQLADALSTQMYDEGDYLIRCGEANQWMFFLMEGEAKITGRKDGKKVDIVTVGPGDVVGELEFLFNHEAVADVHVISTKMKVARLHRKHFEMCMGPVSDNLKEYIAQGNYEHYLEQANSSVKQEMEVVEQRRKAKMDPGSSKTQLQPNNLKFAELGEIVFGGEQSIFRFPLESTHGDGLASVAITEDGTVVFWGDVMARSTHYKSEHVVGQSIFSFLTKQEDQVKMHDLIKTARKWAGNWQGFVATGNYRRDVITFSISSGLTKVQFQVAVIPPMVPQPSSKAEVLFIIGHEVKRKAAQNKIDFGKWLVDSLEPELEKVCTMTKTPEVSRTALADEVDKCLDLAKRYESLAAIDTAEVTDSWQPVSLRVMMNRFITELSSELRTAQNKLNVVTDNLLDDEVFMDVAKLPDALTYLARNASRVASGIDITIRMSIEDTHKRTSSPMGDVGSSMEVRDDADERKICFVVEDTGSGMDQDLIKAVMRRDSFNNSINPVQKKKGGGLRKIYQTVAAMGGMFQIELPETGGTRCTITLPLVLAAADSEDKETNKGRAFTTVMVEHSALHRNMMCQHLWGRRHAVLPATSWKEVVKLVESGNCDILIVDPDYLADENMAATTTMSEFQDPVDILNKYSRNMAVIMTSECYDADEIPNMEQKGFIALPKPCSAAFLHAAILKAESIVSSIREEEEKINALRDTFSKTSRGAHKVIRMLGKGAFGEVYEVEDVLTKGKMAMKQLKVKNEAMADELVDEIRAMTSLKHENIIHYFYCEKVDAANIKIFMELANCGTLQDKVKNAGKDGLVHSDLVKSLRDVLEGLSYIHGRNYVHCDIKTANVLLDSDGRGKLGDFGTARQLKDGEKMYVMMGTPSYMAPEVMNADQTEGIGFDCSADIWSLGIVAMEMATGKPPFYHLPQCQGMGLIRYIAELEETPDLSPLFSKSPLIFEFVKACLEPEPEKRPSAKELLNFSLFDETIDGSDNRVANKLLNRAKLLHVLNKFVAFQDPFGSDGGSGDGDDDDDNKMFRSMTKKNFFDSDEDDEDEDVEDDGGVNAFFDTSDDDDGEEDEEWDGNQAVDDEQRATVSKEGGVATSLTPKHSAKGSGIATAWGVAESANVSAVYDLAPEDE